jgi:hypothetical protein
MTMDIKDGVVLHQILKKMQLEKDEIASIFLFIENWLDNKPDSHENEVSDATDAIPDPNPAIHELSDAGDSDDISQQELMDNFNALISDYTNLSGEEDEDEGAKVDREVFKMAAKKPKKLEVLIEQY